MGGVKGRKSSIYKPFKRSEGLDGRRTAKTPGSEPSRRSESAAPLGPPATPPQHPAQERRSQAAKAAPVRPLSSRRPAYPEPKVLTQEEQERTTARINAAVPGQYKPPPTYDENARQDIARKVAAQGRQAAIHASNYLDGQTGWRARATPRLKALFSSKAATELEEGNNLGEALQPRKQSIDATNERTQEASKAAASGQQASSNARNVRGATQAAAAAATISTGDPILTSAIATAGGAAETRLRAKAEGAHRRAEEGYMFGAEDDSVSDAKKEAIESEALHQSHLAERARRQKHKAVGKTLFGATPGANYMTTGAEQTLTGMAADAARSTFEKSSGATERMAETATRTGEAAAGEVETRITEKTYGRMTRLERARQFLGGISKGTLDAEKVDRIAKLTRYQRAHDGGHSGS